MSEAWSGRSRGRILVADDSLVVRALVRHHLESEGYEVIEAADGFEAIERCRSAPPDVALVDIEMPILDGHGLLRQMKADPLLRDIPVVFLTGRPGTEEMVETLRSGAHDYLRKPFEPAELLARVSAAWRVAHLQHQLTERNAELDQMSRTDPLTGLHNRRHAEEYLGSVAADSKRHGKAYAIVMADVDLFKSVNDRFGHAAGDALLCGLAERLLAVMREGDLAARWGGEEFLLILPDTNLEGAAALGERALSAVRERPFALDGFAPYTATISIGAASGLGTDGEELLRRADAAMYKAKAAGRDQLGT